MTTPRPERKMVNAIPEYWEPSDPVSQPAERERLGRQALSEAMQDTYVSREPEMARQQLDQMWRSLTERGFTVARLSGDDEELRTARRMRYHSDLKGKSPEFVAGWDAATNILLTTPDTGEPSE